LNWLVYGLPPLAILIGVYILFRAMQAWKQPSTVPESEQGLPGIDNGDEYIARLEEELRRR
jgi:hypothetical protein